MSANVIYEIARYDSGEDGAPLLERMQLLSADGVLRLRDAGGSETPCEGADIAAVISSTPSLREIRAGEEVRISCPPEIAAHLPFVLKPVCDDGDSSECYAEVNGDGWKAYPTLDEDYVMLPGWREGEPDMSPCWAEHGFQEGESHQNPLTGHTSIGLATPDVAVEYGRYDAGGFWGGSAVSIRPFDDFPAIFVDWLVNWEVLANLWGGDSLPYSPSVRLFADAAAAADHQGYWNTDMDEDEEETDEDETDEDGDDTSYFASARLELHLSDGLIDQVRVRLSSLDPAYAAILKSGGNAS
jgi:hypothetical protein